jgi:FKBP-type peptidyl-prolyl cis-trans isomerase SlpA
MTQIDSSSRVTLHFALHTAGSVEVDSTFDKQPATFVMGDGSLLPGFETVLLGLQAGDEKVFSLLPVDAFGEINRDSIHILEKRAFGKLELSEGLVVSFAGAGKLAMPGIVKKIDSENVTVDFNHPLAGQVITFKVKVVAVENTMIVRST